MGTTEKNLKAIETTVPENHKFLLDLKETIEATSLGRSTILQLAYSGELPSITVGRKRMFPVIGINKWIADHLKQLELPLEFDEHEDKTQITNAIDELLDDIGDSMQGRRLN